MFVLISDSKLIQNRLWKENVTFFNVDGCPFDWVSLSAPSSILIDITTIMTTINDSITTIPVTMIMSVKL